MSETYLQCPKCYCVSGDSWTQCKGECPMMCSPHYTDAAALKYGPPATVTREELLAQQVADDQAADAADPRDPDDIPY